MARGDVSLILSCFISFVILRTGGEEYTHQVHDCSEDFYFICSSGECISKSFICDGDNDCKDGSDEKQCGKMTTMVPTCKASENRCANGECIPKSWTCDGNIDCYDGSDETLGCSTKMTCDDGFLCKNHHCIMLEWKCDGVDDCTDNSDEENCQRETVIVQDCTLENRFFLCEDHSKCLDFGQLCNAHADCSDGSDEAGKCSDIHSCDNATCTHECHRSPKGHLCVCPKGYSSTHGQCEDINECEAFGTCDQQCTNTPGSYNCSCMPGYKLHGDRSRCKAEGGEAILFFSNTDQVRAMFLDSRNYFPVATKLTDVKGVAYDGLNVYWASYIPADKENRHEILAIVKSSEDGSKREPILTTGLGTPEDLAVDWVTRNIYFTDSQYKHIGVCANDGSVCTVIVNEDLDKPRAIVLHSSEGFMYWTDWGKRPLIARSGMDGSDVTDFITEDIVWPNGVTIDHGANRLYWLEAKHQTIECIRLDGSDRRKVLEKSLKHPFSIAVFEDQLYWSDWEGKEIKSCNKFTGKDQRTIVREKKKNIYGVHVFHPSMELSNLTNPCRDAHCSDMCLLSPKTSARGYLCACPEEKILSSDGHRCQLNKKHKFLVVAFGHTFLQVEQNKLGKETVTQIKFPKLGRIGALTYDSRSGRIIASDSLQKRIVAIDLSRKQMITLINSEIGHISSMDFDPFGENLYWVDEERRIVEVMSLSTMERKTLISDFGGDTPFGLAVVPEDGLMYISLRNGISAHIDQIQMDGLESSRVSGIQRELQGPKVTLAYDRSLHRVYWVDGGAGNIMSTDNSGYGRHKFRQLTTSPTDITFMGNYIYWVNYDSNIVHYADQYDSETRDKAIILEEAEGYEELKLITITGVSTEKVHVCQNNNGGCSHICLLAGKLKRCECPKGMRLMEDDTHCVEVKTCRQDEFRCSTGECIPAAFHCNKRVDCPHHEDEEGCQDAEVSCSPRSFLCHDGKLCIDEIKKCDSVNDCHDNSDEFNCNNFDLCDEGTKFRCGSGECISAAWRCDEKTDCEDNSDEANCEQTKCKPKEQFRCKNGACIPASWECDKQVDCHDASDEHSDCRSSFSCDSNFFSCNNSQCIDEKLVCDGWDDCGDNSDETGCAAKFGLENKPSLQNNKTNIVCADDQFSCSSQPGMCIPLIAKCNGTSECMRGEDEIGCLGCRDNEFQCTHSKKCIPNVWLCDKLDDCGDGSDEENCENKAQQGINKEFVECSGFQCIDNGECIPFNKVCDSKPDCNDGSDEGGKCGSSCMIAGCSEICHETPTGSKCDCPRGFKLLGNARSCADINECKSIASCSHYCKNTPGSFHCSCYEQGYQLREDRIRCKAKGPEMEYLYVTQGEIRFKTRSLSHTGIIFKPVSNLPIDGMDIDTKKRQVYWTSELFGTLSRISMDNQKGFQKVSDLIKPTKVAYDWITGNIYVVEKGYVIRVCNLEKMKCGTVYTGPRDIVIDALVVDAIAGVMFWSETNWQMYQRTKSTLKRSDMSGTNIKTIIEHDLYRVTDITVSPIHHYLYWTDNMGKKIERATYNGTKREIIFSLQDPPIDIGLFEDYVYWVNGKSNHKGHEQFKREGLIGKCGLHGSVNMDCNYFRLLPVGLNQGIQRLRIFHPAVQIDGNNVCNKINCSYMCVKSTTGPSCLCEDGTRVRIHEQCNTSNETNMKPKFLHAVQREKNWGWWILIFITLLAVGGALGYLTFRFSPWLGIGNTVWSSVHFQNPAYELSCSHQVSPFHHTRLTPGQHQYENPSVFKEVEPQVRMKVQNEITVTHGNSSWPRGTRAHLEVVEDDSTDTEFGDIIPEHTKEPLISG